MYRESRDRESRFGGGQRSFAPVNVGDELDLKIEAVGEKGDGIAKIKGFVIFVPQAKQGETVKVKITKVLRKVGFGEIVGKGAKESKKMTEESEEEPEEAVEDSEDFGDEEETD